MNVSFSLILCAAFIMNYALDSHEVHDRNFRKFFCNEAYKRKEITELPAHLLEVCKKSGIDPTTIHVFNDDADAHCADDVAWSFGNAIIDLF